MYLKIVDKFNQWYVSAYVMASGTILLLLHDVQNTDGIRHFFSDVSEIYLRNMMNPLATKNLGVAFDLKVRNLARKWL